MGDISAESVRQLREKSGAGIMECKRALAATGGDLGQAIDYLRKEGVVKAAKKAGRATAEGLIGVALSPDHQAASVVEINCETDFVARTDQFQEFLAAVGEKIVSARPTDLQTLLQQSFGTSTLQGTLTELIARVGENMSVPRFFLIQAQSGEVIGTYLHAGSKIGVVVKLSGQGADAFLARDIAMHAAAMSPTYVDRSQVPSSVIEREQEIARSSPDIVGKPPQIVEKILQGKMERFFAENCLVEQPFVKDPVSKKSVKQFLQSKGPQIQVTQVVRLQVGEENR